MAAHYFFPLYGYTGGNYILAKPLVGGFVCGLVLGDLQTGLMIGCAIQLTYLSYMTIGGAATVDQGFLAYPITAIAIVTKMDAGSAIALGTAVAVIAAYGNSLLRTINLFANSQYQAAIKEGNKAKTDFFYFGLPLFALFVVRFVPSFLMMRFGPEYVEAILAALPAKLLAGLSKFGNFMPAIGISLLMKFLIKEYWYLAFFVFGFTLYAYLGMSVLGACVFALVIALLYYFIISRSENPVADRVVKDEEEVL